MASERLQGGPLDLLDPAQYVEPVPTPGCDVCGALYRQLAEVRTQGPNYDLTRASDIVVEMRRHQDAKGQN